MSLGTNDDVLKNKYQEGSNEQCDRDKISTDEELIECFGTCKWFSVAKGYGFLTLDPQTREEKDIFVYQSNIQMQGFRSLKQGEKVRCWYKRSNLGLEAVKVCGPDGNDCLGIEKKPRCRFSDERCYNCGEIGHHAKECELPPLPKRCHFCKSFDHLVGDCPKKQDASKSNGGSHAIAPPDGDVEMST